MHKRFTVLLLVLALTSCVSVNTTPINPEPYPVEAKPTEADELASTQTAEANSGWYSIYFTDTSNGSLRGGPDAALATAIDEARVSIDLAIYDLNLWSIRDALLNAHERGINIRMITESTNMDREEIQALIDAGISVLGDQNENLMHHKFIIIDQSEIWTGSMNLTVNGAYRNNNNLIRIQSSQLVENYLHEFDEMFVDGLFGDDSRASDTPNPALSINGTLIENYFSPDDNIQSELVDLLNNAQDSIYVLAFAYTADPLTEALLNANARGVQVIAVVDLEQSASAGADYQYLLDNGIEIYTDGNVFKQHHKVFIIDESIVVLGSYNFSRSAEERNDENLLIIYSPTFGAEFLVEFEKILAEAQ